MSGLFSRLLYALIGALAISGAIFLFMQSLIGAESTQDQALPVFEDIRIVREKPDKKPEEQHEMQPQERQAEPSSEPLALAAPVETRAVAPVDLAPLDLAFPVTDVAPGDGWSAPLAGSVVALEGKGQDARGYVEVIPYSTRRPSVPEVAWRNKINGWVLVAFSISTDGKPRDIRVLDADPKGVFEEKVIAAVEDWRYTVKFERELTGDVVLTQKVEVDWQNYPQNIPNVD